ncbi:MAG: glycoside hydrolase family 3 C-terminal domain-containing protein [Anaerolineales bacterium]|nr:glycoside hydrolase family 3 C-terminal domain-containing protein [Anaerolineales bacterium]
MPQKYTPLNQPDPVAEKRVAGLLNQMTLAEKVGQLVLGNAFANIDWEEVIRQKKLAEANGLPYEIPLVLNPVIEGQIRAGMVGSINSADLRLNNHLQRLAVQESRLHIPILVSHDVIHGFRTVFPIPLAESCTWNPALLERAAHVAAVEASTAGINWIFAPMVDIARDPRWGRIAEGAGEDPFLGMAMARARVNGFQDGDLPVEYRIAACPKHYAGYGAAEGGRDYNTVDISERTLRDVYLPPFKAAFEAGAGSTMSAFNEISGVPGTCNTFLLRTVLHEEWGMAGPVVSDYNAIGELVQHGVAQDLRDAARLSILAGVDIDLDSGAYAKYLAQLVEDGSVPMEVVDEAVRRVLRLKVRLGLFEHPYVDESLASKYILAQEAQELALQVARESMVLLKNNDRILPLKQDQKIALIGPLADNRADLLGAWAIMGQASDVRTVLEGFQAYLPADSLLYTPGCSITGDEAPDIAGAVAAAQRSDLVVMVLGESVGLSGESHSRVHPGLPGRQQELVDALVATGKPLIAVLMSGRPLVIPRLAQQVDALLVAWHGGIRAGQAVADIVFDAYNPSGKLTASWPRAEGQIPVYYAHKSTGRPAEGSGTTQFHEPFRSTYLDEPNAPLFSFGEGLSYTQFEYRSLEPAR